MYSNNKWQQRVTIAMAIDYKNVFLWYWRTSQSAFDAPSATKPTIFTWDPPGLWPIRILSQLLTSLPFIWKNFSIMHQVLISLLYSAMRPSLEILVVSLLGCTCVGVFKLKDILRGESTKAPLSFSVSTKSDQSGLADNRFGLDM